MHLPPLSAKKANTIQVLNTVNGLKNLDQNLITVLRKGRDKDWKELISQSIPSSENIINESIIIDTPDLMKFIEIYKLPRLLNRFAFFIETNLSLIKIYKVFRQFNKCENTLVYSRSYILLFVNIILNQIKNKKIRYSIELHDIPKSKVGRVIFNYVISKCFRVFAVTNGFKPYIEIEQRHKIELLPDGVSKEYFTICDTLKPIKENKIIKIGYIGRFTTYGQDKGVNDLFHAFIDADKKDKVALYLIGATNDEYKYYNELTVKYNMKNRIFIEKFMSNKEAMIIASKCDVLIMPHPKTKFYSEFVSPLKLFEYMALGKIIINAELPAIEEILPNKRFSISFTPGDKEDLKNKIEDVVTNYNKYVSFSHLVRNEAKKYTWEKRALKIIEKTRKII